MYTVLQLRCAQDHGVPTQAPPPHWRFTHRTAHPLWTALDALQVDGVLFPLRGHRASRQLRTDFAHHFTGSWGRPSNRCCCGADVSIQLDVENCRETGGDLEGSVAGLRRFPGSLKLGWRSVGARFVVISCSCFRFHS